MKTPAPLGLRVLVVRLLLGLSVLGSAITTVGAQEHGEPRIEWQLARDLDPQFADLYKPTARELSDGGWLVSLSYGLHRGSILRLDKLGREIWRHTDTDRLLDSWETPENQIRLVTRTEFALKGISRVFGQLNLITLDESGKMVPGRSRSQGELLGFTRSGESLVSYRENGTAQIEKLDYDFAPIWQVVPGPSSTTLARELPTGGFVVGSITRSSSILTRLGSDGTILWQKSFEEVLWTMDVVADGILLTFALDQDDFHAFKLNLKGDLLWDIPISGSTNDRPIGVASLPDGGTIIFVLTDSGSFGPPLEDLTIRAGFNLLALQVNAQGKREALRVIATLRRDVEIAKPQMAIGANGYWLVFPELGADLNPNHGFCFMGLDQAAKVCCEQRFPVLGRLGDTTVSPARDGGALLIIPALGGPAGLDKNKDRIRILRVAPSSKIGSPMEVNLRHSLGRGLRPNWTMTTRRGFMHHVETSPNMAPGSWTTVLVQRECPKGRSGLKDRLW